MSCIDPYTGFYVDCGEPGATPIFSGGGVSTGGGVSGGAGNTSIDVSVQTGVQVGVVNQVNVANQVLQSIQGSIEDAITSGIEKGAEIQKQAADAITTAIGQQTNGIIQGANGLFGGIISFIKDGLGNIFSNLGTLLRGVVDNIGTIVGTIATAVKDAINAIGPILQTIDTEVQHVYNDIIQPITSTILQTIQTVGTLTAVIEKDLHEGIQGLLALPGDLANGLASLDATFQRAIEQLGTTSKESVKTDWGPMFADTLGKPLFQMGDSLTSVTGHDARKTTFSDHVKLPEPDISQAGAASIGAIWGEVSTLITNLLHGGQPSLDTLKTALFGVPFLLGDVVELPALITVIVAGIAAGALPLLSFVRGQIASQAGLEKLSPSDAIRAWLRQFIDEKTLAAELGVNGWDAERIQVIKDLQIQLLGVSDVIDMNYRGIVSEDDMRLNMLQHGISPPDQDAIIEASHRLVDVATAALAYRRSEIELSTLTAVLAQNRYTANEQELYLKNLYRPAQMAELSGRYRRGFLEGRYLNNDSDYVTVPQAFFQAGKAEGIQPDAIEDEWRSQFLMPSLGEFLSLVFRGIRTSEELGAMFDYYRVPQAFRDDYIRANQALIPFRTIPTMLAGGIISEAYAKQQLTAHGFSLTDVNHLIDYAKIKNKAAPAAQAATLKTLSTGSARQAWTDGVITEAQYREVLASHGMAADAVDLTIRVETLQETLKERAQQAQDVINETLAGFITSDEAQSRLAQLQFTQAEQAKYLKQLKRAQVKTAKMPSLDELHKFWKAQIIDEPTFRQGVAALGYAQQWVDAFATLFAPLEAATEPTTP